MDVMRKKSPIWREKGVELHCKCIALLLLFHCFSIAFAVLVFSIKSLKYMKNVKNAFGREKNFPTIVFHFVSRRAHTAWLWIRGRIFLVRRRLADSSARCALWPGPAARHHTQPVEKQRNTEKYEKNCRTALETPPAGYYVLSTFKKGESHGVGVRGRLPGAGLARRGVRSRGCAFPSPARREAQPIRAGAVLG